MKISLEWLAEYLPGPLDARELAERLTHAGLPVEVIEQVGDDTVLDVEVTSNRSDCLSYLGVARELGALLGRPFKDVRAGEDVPEAAAPASGEARVDIEATDLCPHYIARVLKNIRIAPAPPGCSGGLPPSACAPSTTLWTLPTTSSSRWASRCMPSITTSSPITASSSAAPCSAKS